MDSWHYTFTLELTVESMVHIFADDTKIDRKITTKNDCVELKNNLLTSANSVQSVHKRISKMGTIAFVCEQHEQCH